MVTIKINENITFTPADNQPEWMAGRGIALLRWRAREAFQTATGIKFPWQLTTHQTGFLDMRESKWWAIEPAHYQAELEAAARYAGWLKAAQGLEGVRRILQAGMTENGLGSPYQHFAADDLVVKWPSPHRLERMSWSVRNDAQEILDRWGFTGARPSWVDTGLALLGQRRPRRAALALAALTMIHGGQRPGPGWWVDRHVGGTAYNLATPPTWRWVRDVLVLLAQTKTPGPERVLADGTRLWRERATFPTRKGTGYRWVPSWRIVTSEGWETSLPAVPGEDPLAVAEEVSIDDTSIDTWVRVGDASLAESRRARLARLKAHPAYVVVGPRAQWDLRLRRTGETFTGYHLNECVHDGVIAPLSRGENKMNPLEIRGATYVVTSRTHEVHVWPGCSMEELSRALGRYPLPHSQ